MNGEPNAARLVAAVEFLAANVVLEEDSPPYDVLVLLIVSGWKFNLVSLSEGTIVDSVILSFTVPFNTGFALTTGMMIRIIITAMNRIVSDFHNFMC